MNKISLRQYLTTDEIGRLALPSNTRYGRAIHARHGVEIIDSSPHKVEGWVGGLDGTTAEGGGQRRRVIIMLTEKGLTWHCAGNPKDHQIFCKHCVALALALEKIAYGNSGSGAR